MADMKSKQGGDTSAVVKKTTADGPRAPKSSRRASPQEPPASRNFGAGYSDASTTGWFDETESFKSARGNPGPRGPEGAAGGTHQEPGDASIAAAVPLT
jgi:hypothetical protein